MASRTGDRVERLKRLRDNYELILIQLSEDALGNPKANPTYSVDGQSMNKTEYQAFLHEKLENLERQIQRASAPGGFEVRSRAVSY